MMTFLAPAICLIAGIGSAGYTFYRWKNGGTLKLKTLIIGIIGVPAGIAYLLQYFGMINVEALAKGLGSEYYQNRVYEQQVKEINEQVKNGELSQEKADILIQSLKN